MTKEEKGRRGLVTVRWVVSFMASHRHHCHGRNKVWCVCCYHDASGQSSEHGFVQVEGSVGGGDNYHAVLRRAQTVPLLHQRRLHGGEGAMRAVVTVLAGRQHRVHFVEVDHARREASSEGEDSLGVLFTLT